MMNLQEVYRNACTDVPVSGPAQLTEGQERQLRQLERTLESLSSGQSEFGVDRAGYDMAIGIEDGENTVMIPFTLQADPDGSARVQVDRHGEPPASFDLYSDEIAFVKFLARERSARIARKTIAIGAFDFMMD